MPSNARQRTAAQRKPKDDGDQRLEPSEVLDEQEQAAEIKEIKKKNKVYNERTQGALDIGIFVIIFYTAFQFLEHLERPSPLTVLAFIQLALLPLSLTPHWLPLFSGFMRTKHPYVALGQVFTFAAAFSIVHHDFNMPELVRWALPELIAGAVEMQRRSERDTEAKIRDLEGLRYDHKGA